MVGERQWKAPRMVALTSTENNTVFGLHCPENQERLVVPELNVSQDW
jgi:hypothetical protein